MAIVYATRIEGLTEGLATRFDIVHRGEMSFGSNYMSLLKRKKAIQTLVGDSPTFRAGPTRSWSSS